VLSQVLPARIRLFDHRDLFLTPPTLELFFTAECIRDVSECLVVDETMDLVFLGEAFDGIDLMLTDAPLKIAGYADVKRTGTTGQDVNPESVKGTIAHGGRC